MKDEIKEFLQEIESVVDKKTKIYIDELEEKYDSLILQLLYDIDNLREENEHLDKVNCELRKKINNRRKL